MQKKVGKGSMWRPPGATWLVSLMLAVMLLPMACVPPGSAPMVMPESPLIPGANLALAANRWHLVTVQQGKRMVNFTAVKPVYIWFDVAGTLNIYSTHCAGGAYRIVAENERQYKLTDSMFGAIDCGAVRNTQFARVTDALAATTTYELRDNQLWLTGEDVVLTLEIEQPFSLAPGTLTQNRWRLVEVVYRNQVLEFGHLQPIHLRFWVGGSLTVNPAPPDCTDVAYTVRAENAGHYRLTLASSTNEDCGEPGNTQLAQVHAAIASTTAYATQQHRLVLTGSEVRIVLEADNGS